MKASKSFPLWFVMFMFLVGAVFGFYCMVKYFEYRKLNELQKEVTVKTQTAECDEKNKQKL
jgi:RsiW-degrading membrane proteinase PrsW (M82 family)